MKKNMIRILVTGLLLLLFNQLSYAEPRMNYFPSNHSGGQADDITEIGNYPPICRGDSGPRLPGLNLARAYYGAAACPRTNATEGQESQIHHVLLIDDTNRLSDYLVELLNERGLVQQHRGRPIVRPAVVPLVQEGQDTGMNIHVLGEMAYQLDGSDPNSWFGVLADSAGEGFCELPSDVEQLVERYAGQTVAMNNEIRDRLLEALTNFQRAMEFESEFSTRADIAGAMADTALKEAKKYILGKIGSQVPGFSVAVSFVESAINEVERAENAQQSYNMGAWIRQTSRTITNCMGNSGCTQGSTNTTVNTPESVRNGIELQICNLPENRRGQAVDAINQALGESLVQGVPVLEAFERSMYEGWINGHYSTSGEDYQPSSGTIDIRFETDGNGEQITVENDSKTITLSVAKGDRAETGLTEVMNALQLSSVLDLKVHKKVCFRMDTTTPGGRSWSCWWLDDENDVVRRGHPYPDAQAAFTNTGWRDKVRRFLRR